MKRFAVTYELILNRHPCWDEASLERMMRLLGYDKTSIVRLSKLVGHATPGLDRMWLTDPIDDCGPYAGDFSRVYRPRLNEARTELGLGEASKCQHWFGGAADPEKLQLTEAQIEQVEALALPRVVADIEAHCDKTGCYPDAFEIMLVEDECHTKP